MDRATFEIGREPPKDDGLRQIEPDDGLTAWANALGRIAPPRRPEPLDAPEESPCA